ncbi:MAG: hypothetical protein J6X03_05740, partial [Bacilli bacterium]|nr:hypothetical protein [Bacilli bacterium]
MKYINKIILILFLLFISSTVSAKQISIYLFHSSDCVHCKAEIKFLDEIKDKYDIKIYKYEVMYNEENREILKNVRELLKNDGTTVPFTIIGETTFTGFSDVQRAQIEKAIEEYQEVPYCDKVGLYLGKTTDDLECKEKTNPSDEDSKMNLPLIGEVDVKEFSLPIIAIVIGLVDGFNPCAMWVLIFLLSILIGMKNRKKMWILGLTFIATSALVYLLIMVAWLNIVASFTTIRWLQIAIAVVALVAGGINLRSYFKARKEDDGCTVTDADSRKKIIGKVKKIALLEQESESGKKKFAFLLAILGVIALAVSAMPEGLNLALTMALTIASKRMAKKNVIVKKLNAVESLGSCTVIASDKTGTLTVHEQTAKEIVLADGSTYKISGTGYNADGKVEPVGKASMVKAKEIAMLGALNTEAHLDHKEDGSWEFFGDSIDIAFLSLAKKMDVVEYPDISEIIPYESENQYSAVFYRKGNETYCTVKGS